MILIILVTVGLILLFMLWATELKRGRRLSKLQKEVNKEKSNLDNYLVSLSNRSISSDETFKIAEHLHNLYVAEHLFEAAKSIDELKEQKLNKVKTKQMTLTNETSKSLYEILGGGRWDTRTLQYESQHVGEKMNNELTLFVN